GFWKAGVPRNYAYRPHGLLIRDIGIPENTIPQGKRPMDLLWYGHGRTTCPSGDCKIGDTTSTTLKVPISSTTDMEIKTVPTYIYILQQIDSRNYTNRSGTVIPFDAVYARNYTKGLVVYRTLFQYSGLWNGYEDSIATVTLPGFYRKVNYDGTLGPVTDKITLRGFEGAILVKAEHYPPDRDTITNIKDYLKISLFSDNYSPQPGDIITYRAVLRNISTTTLVRTRFSFPLTTLINQN
ncbi:MAG: hypothetical protein NZ822_03365, partial [Patescibacteria group bacterium]|nr:hypothetical protein [Patescibacteria group bacterium]